MSDKIKPMTEEEITTLKLKLSTIAATRIYGAELSTDMSNAVEIIVSLQVEKSLLSKENIKLTEQLEPLKGCWSCYHDIVAGISNECEYGNFCSRHQHPGEFATDHWEHRETEDKGGN